MSEPLVIGQFYYIKAKSVFRKCQLKRLLPEMGGTARVQYYATGELLTCRQSELKTESEYKQILKERRDKSYRDYRKRELTEVIHHWENGRRTAEAMLEASKTKDLTFWNRQIRIAKKYEFIE